MPRLLYISAWNHGNPRGGFFSALTLLEHLRTWEPLLWVGERVRAAAGHHTRLPLVAPGYSDAPGSTGRGTRLVRLVGDIRALRRRLLELRPDVVVGDYEVFLPAAIACRMAGRPFAFYLRAVPNLARRRKLALALRLCTGGFFLSPSLRDSFCQAAGREFPDGRAFVVPNSLLPHWFGPRDRPSGGTGPQPFRIGLVGALCPQKNQLWFIQKVVPLLDPGHTGTEIHLFGDDVDAAYAAQVRDAVRSSRPDIPFVLHGFEPSPVAIYSRFDVLVQVSTAEGIARAVIEGAAWEIPAVAREIIGVTDYVHDGRTGFVVRTPEEMKARLDLLRDESRRRQCGAAAFRRVADTHHPERVAVAFEQGLERLAATHSPAPAG